MPTNSQKLQVTRIVALWVDINNLGKIGGLSIGDFLGFFVKVPVFGRIVQVRLTERAR
ncbi:MAG: hypothetical protein ACK449_18105 [Planctomycetota bacterium]